MKTIKYLIAALLFGATLTSCVEEAGTVGQTTVQFKEEQVVAGFGAEYVYVPISIFGANADAMNTADVTVKVKLDDTYTSNEAGVEIATNDLTGKAEDGGDIRITSCDLVFRNNYNIADEDKKKPYTKEVEVEIMIINKDPEIMEFKLVIEDSNTTIGAVKECLVRLEKGPADRLCGEWWASYTGTLSLTGGADAPGPWQTEMYYENQSGRLFFYDGVYGKIPFVFYFDEKSEVLTYPTFEVLMPESEGYYFCQSVFTLTPDGYISFHKEDSLACEYDNKNYSYVKIDDLNEWVTAPLILPLDESYNIVSGQSIYLLFEEAFYGLQLSRTKPVGKSSAPALAAENVGMQRVKATPEQEAAIIKAYNERFRK
ncbi:MAG: hypothetical protein J6U53_06710 [Tidjanibacter sp.]|nr:hypothetical protein [Tidjanibacter sp.]